MQKFTARLGAIGVAALVSVGCSEQAPPESSTLKQHVAGSSAPETATDVEALADQLAAARLATARYMNDLDQAQADGYQVITPTMPGMGVHYLNPEITDFHPGRPPILVYVPTDEGSQLAALEWVFPQEPDQPPPPGASYGEFPAACHFVDGTFVPTDREEDCGEANPDTGSTFSFWHGRLVTMHVWLWYHNPDGLFAGTNPLVAPFNDGTLTVRLGGR